MGALPTACDLLKGRQAMASQDYLNMGGLTRKFTTSSADCQLWMDRGLVHSYGYSREEAIRCFEKALTFDEGCVMAHYFIALNQGSDYNNPDGMDYALGYRESQKALEMSESSTSSLFDWEVALIKAQVHRFCWPVCAKPMEELIRDYANAMRPVYQEFLDDPDVTAIFAESLMMLAPWKLWTPPPDVVKPAIPETEELVRVLEKALSTYPTHAGLCHCYIHLMELSPSPEKALPAADVLRVAYPDLGHLVHMPSHIDMWVGQYEQAVEANKKAIISDKRYMAVTGQNNEFYKMYRMHNYHFCAWAAMFDGQFATAMSYAEEAERQLDPEAVTFKLEPEGFPLGSVYLEAFGSIVWHVLVRFGRWEDIVRHPMKEDGDMYAGTVAASLYARGVAFAAMGKIEEAEAELVKFTAALENKALEGRHLFNNVMHDPKDHTGILDVADAVLKGEIEYRKGNYPLAFQHLRLAVKRDANLIYDEPWAWMMPARQSLGALLLEQGEVVEAENMYRSDLEVYKNNIWSLKGLFQALKQQGREAEAQEVKACFEKASARADVKIGASCLCASKLSKMEYCC